MTQAPVFGPDAHRMLTRRGMCQSLLASLCLPVLAGCAAVPALRVGGATAGGAALLLPLTGSAATLGQNMARAASLVTQALPAGAAPPVISPQE